MADVQVSQEIGAPKLDNYDKVVGGKGGKKGGEKRNASNEDAPVLSVNPAEESQRVRHIGRVATCYQDPNYFGNLFYNPDGSLYTYEQIAARFPFMTGEFMGKKYNYLIDSTQKVTGGKKPLPIKVISPIALLSAAKKLFGTGNFNRGGEFDAKTLDVATQQARITIDPESITCEREYPSTGKDGITTMKKVVLEDLMPGLAEEHVRFEKAMKVLFKYIGDQLYELPEANEAKTDAKKKLQNILKRAPTPEEVKEYLLNEWSEMTCLREPMERDGEKVPRTLVATSSPIIKDKFKYVNGQPTDEKIFEYDAADYQSGHPVYDGYHIYNQSYVPVKIINRDGTVRNAPLVNGKKYDPARQICKTDDAVQFVFTVKPNFKSLCKGTLKEVITWDSFHNPKNSGRHENLHEEPMEEEGDIIG